MAGRGRGATLPAWMTANGNANPTQISGSAPAVADPPIEIRRREDRREEQRDDRERRDDGEKERRDRRDRDRKREEDGKRKRSRSRSRDKKDDKRDSSKRSSSPGDNTKNSLSIPTWRPKSSRGGSNFDKKPPPGVELPPIGVVTPVNGIPNSFFSFSNNPLGLAKEGRPGEKVDNSLHTRHARRIYAGGIPSHVTEEEVYRFFNGVVKQLLPPGSYDGHPVSKVYLNTEKNYAFVEFPSIELTNACMQLDGIRFDHSMGSAVIRVRRPTDYRPELIPPGVGPTPVLNSEVLTSLGASGGGGPGKIFIGGLPYNLADEQVIELLSAFGPIKSFHQVRDPGFTTSKGYAFCEYYTKEVSDTAIEGLNGMPLADKVLTVKYAAQGSTLPMPSLASNLLMNTPYEEPQMQQAPIQQQQQQQAPLAYNYGNSVAMNNILNSVPTRVLRLGNMVTHDDLMNDSEYNDIREDVRLECEEFGPVMNVVIPRIKDGFPAGAEGYIYVEFTHIESARVAAMALNGRKFADRSVMVTYYDEMKFAGRIFY